MPLIDRFFWLCCLLALMLIGAPRAAAQDRPPNVVVVFIDDLGYGDLGCFGWLDAPTPNMDKLATQGLRLTQFYVNSPICSPSRVALTTGTYPSRWGISGHFDSRRSNARRGMPDFLDPALPTLARTLKHNGYATAHFGKWHMGGGRDVGDAPLPQAYGFDESLVCFEGLGDRLLINNDGLSNQSAELGGSFRFVDKHELTGIYVDHAIDFIQRHKDSPFYVRLFPNDVHDAFHPTDQMLARFEQYSANKYVQQYYAVVDNLDRQLGRLFKTLDELELTDSTIVVLTSDNGPTAWARYYNEKLPPPGSTGGLRGRKWSLYEGGVREPFIVRWPGHVPAGVLDTQSVVAAMDLFPTLCAMIGVEPVTDINLDGLDRSGALLGTPIPDRGAPIFWEYGRNEHFIQPGLEHDQSPPLAVRDGGWKLLMTPDGSRLELYHLDADPHEIINLADQHPDLVEKLRGELLDWWGRMPKTREELPGGLSE